MLDDVSIPFAQLGPLIDKVEIIAAERELDIRCFGHGGIGVMHPIIIHAPDEGGRIQGSLVVPS